MDGLQAYNAAAHCAAVTLASAASRKAARVPELVPSDAPELDASDPKDDLQ
jgi:hypothetical protein